MTKMSFFAAATAVAALTAAPAFAANDDMSAGKTAKPAASSQMKTQKKAWRSTSRMSQDRGYDRMALQRQGWNGNNRGGNSAQYGGRWDNGRGWNESRADFWPGDVAGGAVGTAAAVTAGAVDTAGAIATAPFGSYRGSYAYDRSYGYQPGYDVGYNTTYNYNGVAIPYSGNYAERNGFTCQPGAPTRMPNGQTVICQ
ncbi:MAG: hypothetical protein AB1342_16730 [Pseudomonadota bacterium]